MYKQVNSITNNIFFKCIHIMYLFEMFERIVFWRLVLTDSLWLIGLRIKYIILSRKNGPKKIFSGKWNKKKSRLQKVTLGAIIYNKNHWIYFYLLLLSDNGDFFPTTFRAGKKKNRSWAQNRSSHIFGIAHTVAYTHTVNSCG